MLLKNVIDEIIQEDIIKLVISNKLNKEVEYYKITFVLKEDEIKQYYQIEKCTDKQVFHQNIDIEMLEKEVLEYVKSEIINKWMPAQINNI